MNKDKPATLKKIIDLKPFSNIIKYVMIILNFIFSWLLCSETKKRHTFSVLFTQVIHIKWSLQFSAKMTTKTLFINVWNQ